MPPKATPKTFDDHADALTEILAGAEAAAASGEKKRIEKARDEVRGFIEGSNDLIPGVIELDDVAASARRDLVLCLLQGAFVDDLMARTSDVSRLVKQFSGQSAANNSKAAEIRLERVRALTDAAITVVDELKRLDELTDGATADGKSLAAAIDAAIKAVERVQKRLAS